MTADAAGTPGTADRRPRVAYLAYWTTEYDSRLERMVRTSLADGWDVTVYGRLMPRQAATEQRDGYRVVRVPAEPSLRALFGRRPKVGSVRSQPARTQLDGGGGSVPDAEPAAAARNATGRATPATAAPRRLPGGARGRVRDSVERTPLAGLYAMLRRRWHAIRDLPTNAKERLDDRQLAPRRWVYFLEQISGWAVALDHVVEPVDVWHGMSIGALPAIIRQRRRRGGRAVYDALDIHLHARSMEHAAAPLRLLHGTLERRWARRADAVMTVNEGCATVLQRELGVARPTVVLNCPEWTPPPDPRPNLIRERLGLGSDTPIVLYHGGMLSERGIEEGMDAIVDVPEAVFVILGYGPMRASLAARALQQPYAGKVYLIDAVPPAELLRWTASADVILVAIQPTTLNHRLATPNKLFEAMMSGVPVVAADLPEMARIIRETGAGVLVDPTDPAAIARAIRGILDATPEERELMRARALEAARSTYHWEAQAGRLRGLHRQLLDGRRP